MARRDDILADLDEIAAAAGWTTARTAESARLFEIVIGERVNQVRKYLTVFVGPRGAVEARLTIHTFVSTWKNEVKGRLAWPTAIAWLRSP